MSKHVFHFFVLGVAVLLAANSAHAASLEYRHGELRTTAQSAEPVAEALAWSEQSTSQVALTSFFERISGGGGLVEDGDGKGCPDDCVGNWRDNTEVWMGFDAHRAFGDGRFAAFFPLPFATANSMGAVAGFNSGIGLGNSKVRAQVGASYGVYDFKGRTIDDPGQEASLEQQAYFTFGTYKRSDVCCGDRISWGVVYDQFIGHQWGWTADEVHLGQLRGILGYALNEHNEVGVWGTAHTDDDVSLISGVGAGIPTTIRAMHQVNAYWRHNWHFGANSMLYVGAVDKADVGSWQFGMTNTAPLNHSTSLYGNFTYAAPGSATGLVGAAEEQWYVSVGLVFSLGAKAQSATVSGNRGLPLLPVANNGSFLITN